MRSDDCPHRRVLERERRPTQPAASFGRFSMSPTTASRAWNETRARHVAVCLHPLPKTTTPSSRRSCSVARRRSSTKEAFQDSTSDAPRRSSRHAMVRLRVEDGLRWIPYDRALERVAESLRVFRPEPGADGGCASGRPHPQGNAEGLDSRIVARLRGRQGVRDESTPDGIERCSWCVEWSPARRPRASRRFEAAFLRRFRPTTGESRTWAVGVTTSPRRQPTIDGCLDTLRRAGWSHPHVFVDGDVSIDGRHGDLPVTKRWPRSGAWPNFFAALSELILRQPDADAYFLLQDDALLYDRENLREYLEEILWPDSGHWLRLALFVDGLHDRDENGWFSLENTWVWGALAIILPGENAWEFVGHERALGHRRRKGGLRHVDTALGEWAAETNRKTFFPPAESRAAHRRNELHLGARRGARRTPGDKVSGRRVLRQGAAGDSGVGARSIGSGSRRGIGRNHRARANGNEISEPADGRKHAMKSSSRFGPRYLNSDLCLSSASALEELAEGWEDHLSVLYCGRDPDGRWTLSACAIDSELDGRTPTQDIGALLGAIDALDDPLTQRLRECESREINVGLEAGSSGPGQVLLSLPPTLTRSLSDRGITIAVTVYPFEEAPLPDFG